MTVVNHVGLCVRDIDKAKTFYEQVLGFSERNRMRVPDQFTTGLLRVPEPVGLTAVYLVRDGFTIELIHFDREGNDPARERSFTQPGITHISLCVDDVQATCALVEEHGGEVLRDTEIPGMAVMVRDPDGQTLELLPMSYRSTIT